MDDTEVTPAPAHRGPDRTLVAVLVAIGVIVVVALVVVLTRGSAAPLDPSTPEGVVQRYAQAVADGDDGAALEYLAPAAQRVCSDEYGSDADVRLGLVESKVTGDSAVVIVSLTTTYGFSPFGSSQSRFEESFALSKSGGDWLIERAPWEFLICEPVVGN